MQYDFEWDPAKARENLRNHRVSFERAAQVFRDALAISIYDEEHSEGEERWITLGRNGNQVLLIVVHTFLQVDQSTATLRLISARRATKREAQQYHER